MAAAPIIYLADATLTLKLAGGGTAAEYNGHVTTAEVVPTAGDQVSTTTLDGVKHTRLGAPSYALHLAGHQDYSATGLARFLWDHAGELADFTLQAYGQGVAPSAATPSFTGQVTLAEGNYGGEVDSWPTIDVTLMCKDRPVITESVLMADEEESDTATATAA
jgi:hypothetical protein